MKLFNNSSKVLLTGCMAVCGTSIVYGSTKPNVVLIIVDQMTADAASCMGNEYVKTPAIDYLAGHGIRFTRSYVTQPLSSPCRSSLQTGMYPHENGVVKNGSKLKDNVPMLGAIIRGAGYETAYFGKWHVPCALGEAGYDVGDKETNDSRTTEKAVEYLQSTGRDPFYLTVSYVNPHNVCQLVRKQDLPQGAIPEVPDKDEELPPLPSNFEIPQKEPDQIRKVQTSIREHYPTIEWTDKEWRQYLWGYYRLVEKVDREIGMLINAIDRLDRETIVIFISDHGEGVAKHHWNQKQILYEQSIKVPTIISIFGGKELKSTISDNLVSMSVDVTATIIDITGAEKDDRMSGQSLYPIIKKARHPKGRKYVYVETRFAQGLRELGLHGRAIVSDRYKYCIYDRGNQREQLFDLSDDPGEEKNLIEDSDCFSVLKELKEELRRWATATKDDEFNY